MKTEASKICPASASPSANSQINVPQIESRAGQESYLHRVLVAFDQFGNVVLGGHPDETISSRSARAAARGDLLGKFMCWWLDKIQAHHGVQAEAADLGRAETVEQIEDRALGENP
jgi:hypothetical protein